MHELLEIAIVIISAKIGGEVSEYFGQSPILGQIIVGMVLGPSALGLVAYDEMIKLLAEFGIIFLIFMVGLQTRPRDIKEVGVPSGLLALGGVILPFLGGIGSAFFFGFHWQEGLILGAALSATSVALTAGVLMDLGRIRTKAAEMILAAAVIDDVIGLLILTMTIAVLGAGGMNPIISLLYALIFWAVLFPVGWKAVPIITSRLRRMKTEGGLFVIVLGILFLFAFAAESTGLAGIVGAFLMGMILSETHDSDMIMKSTLPIYYFLAPVFFVSIGILFDISVLLSAPLMVTVVTVVAILGKIAGSGIGTMISGVSGKVSLFIGFGMVPRGEVALIIAGFARTFETDAGNPLLGSELFSVITGMSLITILVTPSILKFIGDNYSEYLDKVK